MAVVVSEGARNSEKSVRVRSALAGCKCSGAQRVSGGLERWGSLVAASAWQELELESRKRIAGDVKGCRHAKTKLDRDGPGPIDER